MCFLSMSARREECPISLRCNEDYELYSSSWSLFGGIASQIALKWPHSDWNDCPGMARIGPSCQKSALRQPHRELTVLRPKPRVIVLSGTTATGKSAFAQSLHRQFGFYVFRTKDYLKGLLGPRLPSRANLIEIGEQMDARDGGEWIAGEATRLITERSVDRLCVDRVRKPGQVRHIRSRKWHCVHVHFIALPDVLRHRFVHRSADDYLEDLAFASVVASDAVFELDLRSMADFVFDTSENGAAEFAAEIARRIRLT